MTLPPGAGRSYGHGRPVSVWAGPVSAGGPKDEPLGGGVQPYAWPVKGSVPYGCSPYGTPGPLDEAPLEPPFAGPPRSKGRRLKGRVRAGRRRGRRRTTGPPGRTRPDPAPRLPARPCSPGRTSRCRAAARSTTGRSARARGGRLHRRVAGGHLVRPAAQAERSAVIPVGSPSTKPSSTPTSVFGMSAIAAVPPYGDGRSVTRMPCRLASWPTTNRPSCSLLKTSNSGGSARRPLQLQIPLLAHPEAAVLNLDREAARHQIAGDAHRRVGRGQRGGVLDEPRRAGG